MAKKYTAAAMRAIARNAFTRVVDGPPCCTEKYTQEYR